MGVSHIRESIIYDDEGRPVGVIVPYDEWLSLHARSGLDPKRRVDASRIPGKLDWPVDPLEFQHEAREECQP